MKKILFILGGILLLLPFNVFALEIVDDKVITSSGGELSYERYKWLLTKKTKSEIDRLPIKVLEFYNSPGLVVLGSASSTVNSVYEYDNTNNLVSVNHNVEMSSEYINDLGPIVSIDNAYETTSKAINLEYLYDSTTGEYMVEFVNSWKVTPSVKSYDVIAVRWTGTPDVYNVYGYQYDVRNIYYSYKGTNMKLESGGVGISMNLIDDCTTPQNAIYVFSNKPFGRVIASYQHATRNVSLTQSQAYNFGSSGLGGVIDFVSSTVRGYYDGMPGLSLTSYTSIDD